MSSPGNHRETATDAARPAGAQAGSCPRTTDPGPGSALPLSLLRNPQAHVRSEPKCWELHCSDGRYPPTPRPTSWGPAWVTGADHGARTSTCPPCATPALVLRPSAQLHTPPRCFPRRPNVQPCSCPAPRPDSLQTPVPPDPPPATGPSPQPWGLAPSLLTLEGQPRAGTAGPASALCSIHPSGCPGACLPTAPRPSSRHTDPQLPVSPSVCLGWCPPHLHAGLCACPPSRPVLSCPYPGLSRPRAS